MADQYRGQVQPVNPKPFLTELIDKPILVRLKWGMVYKGIRISRHTSGL